MAVKYLSFPNTKSASDKSAADWLTVLGRPKAPQDVTTYLWAVLTNPKDGTALGVIPDSVLPLLAVSDQASLLPATDPTVLSTLDAAATTAPLA